MQRRDLVQTDTESGTLSYANPQTVYDRLTGTITWLPSIGQVIHPGEALFRVNGAPVILMDGSTPAYRDLGPSDSDGQDILQLNRNLVALGFNPDGIAIDDVWQAATTAGVDLFQESLGETETGTLTLGQIVFLPGAQVVSTVSGTVGGSGSNASYSPSGNPAPEYVGLTTTRARRPRPRRPARRPRPLARRPRPRLRASPRSITSRNRIGMLRRSRPCGRSSRRLRRSSAPKPPS